MHRMDRLEAWKDKHRTSSGLSKLKSGMWQAKSWSRMTCLHSATLLPQLRDMHQGGHLDAPYGSLGGLEGQTKNMFWACKTANIQT